MDSEAKSARLKAQSLRRDNLTSTVFNFELETLNLKQDSWLLPFYSRLEARGSQLTKKEQALTQPVCQSLKPAFYSRLEARGSRLTKKGASISAYSSPRLQLHNKACNPKPGLTRLFKSRVFRSYFCADKQA